MGVTNFKSNDGMQHTSLWLHALINYTHPSSSITSDRSCALCHSLNSELDSYREQIMCGQLNSNFKLTLISTKLLEQFKDTLPYMPSEYCGKQQYGFCTWLLGRLRMIETLFGAEIMTVG